MEILLGIQPWMAEGGEGTHNKIIHKIITQVLFTQSLKKIFNLCSQGRRKYINGIPNQNLPTQI